MKVFKASITLTLIALASTLNGQDLHFSNYNFAETFFNPAQTGDFLGSYRISAIARDQWSTFIFEPYQTQMISIDSPQAFGFRKQDWIGLGLSVYSDKAGDIGFKSNGFVLSAAYHYALDKKQKQVLTFGAQYGQIQRNSTDPENALFEDDLNGSGTSSPDRALLEQFRDNYPDLNIGVQYKARHKKNDFFEIGISMHHLLNADFEGLGSQNDVPARLNFYVFHRHVFNKRFELKYGQWASSSGFLSKRQTFHMNVNIQLLGIYHLAKKKKGRKSSEKKQKEIDLLFGLGYRVGDAMIFTAGMNYEQWSIGFSFDMTISEASNYNSHNGAYELGLKRIINIYKKPTVDNVILCPKF